MAIEVRSNKGFVWRRVRGIVSRMSDLTPAWTRIRDQFYDEETRVFDAEGGYGGRAKWAPLSPQYAKWKARVAPGAKILHLTGAGFHGGAVAVKGKAVRKWQRALRKTGRHRTSLRANLTSVRGGTWRIRASSLSIGSDVKVGRYFLAQLHDRGTGQLPRRRLFQVTRAQMNCWLAIIREHIRSEQR